MEKEEESMSFIEPNTVPQDTPTPISSERQKIKFSLVDKWKEIMKSIKEKTGIDGIYVIIFLFLCVLLVYFGIFESLITSLVGTIYPGFCTIKAIQKNQNKKDWLTYWVIFGSFLIFDMFSGIIMKFIPYYFVLKILFLIWMFIPGSNGCRIVYDFLISKVMEYIEQFISIFSEEYEEAKGEILKGAVKKFDNAFKKIDKIKEMMKVRNLNKKNIASNIDNNVNPNSISTFTPPVYSEELISGIKTGEYKEEKKEEKKEDKKDEKKEEKKEEDKEKEKYINFSNDIEEFKKKMSNESQNDNKEKEDDGMDLSME